MNSLTPFKNAFLSRTLAVTFLISFLFIPASQASEAQFYITNYWVEDGSTFHVALATTPSNASCPLVGEGLIEIEVNYWSGSNSELNSGFGFALWYPAPRANMRVFTQAEAYGSLCTKWSPCRIQDIKVSGTWCPPTNGLFLEDE